LARKRSYHEARAGGLSRLGANIVLGAIGLHARPTKIARVKKYFFFVCDRLGG